MKKDVYSKKASVSVVGERKKITKNKMDKKTRLLHL